MFLRDRTLDLAVLYSLKRDLESFWQRKAFKWEALLRRQAAIAESRQHTYLEESEENSEIQQQNLLEAQEVYLILRRRIIEQRKQAFEITHFLGIAPPEHLAGLTFTQGLPDNKAIEGAIDEVAVLAHYITHLHYPMQTVRFLLSSTWEWMKSLVHRR